MKLQIESEDDSDIRLELTYTHDDLTVYIQISDSLAVVVPINQFRDFIRVVDTLIH